MREEKYQEDPFDRGVEELNTFRPRDSWESQFSVSGKNPFIFDFAVSQWENLASLALNSTRRGFGLGTVAERLNARKAFHIGMPGRTVAFYNEQGLIDFNFATGRPFDNVVGTVNNPEGSPVKDVAPILTESNFGVMDSDYAEIAGQTTFELQQRVSRLDVFRAGYVEFSFKTEKSNCIILSGSREVILETINNLNFGTGVNIVPTRREWWRGSGADTIAGNEGARPIDDEKRVLSPNDSGSSNMEIGLDNGKIFVRYYDKYSETKDDFYILGEQRVDDNNWHHVVVNFVKPGLRKDHSEKFNQNCIELWIDAELEKRFYGELNEKNYFFPTIRYIGNSVEKMLPPGSPFSLTRAISSEESKKRAFAGSIHTVAHGLFVPISKFEINKRYNVWRNLERESLSPRPMLASSSLFSAKAETNKKKAIKLFWNNLEKQGKFGVELDENFAIDSYSVTHRSKNSKTEIYNFDTSNLNDINFFENVRVAFTQNVLVQGPGRLLLWEDPNKYFSPFLFPLIRANGTRNPREPRLRGSGPANRILDIEDPLFDNVASIFNGEATDLSYSGIKLEKGDRILLTNQIISSENGIWIYNGESEYLTRDSENLFGKEGKENFVYAEEGFMSKTYWKLKNVIDDIAKPQIWEMVYSEDSNLLQVAPQIGDRWSDQNGRERFISLSNDIDISEYDVLVFMNYPETYEEIVENFPNESDFKVKKMYDDFVNEIVTAAANGLSVFVSSPKLAEDMGIVKEYSEIPQLFEEDDEISANLNPFELNEPKERYFDTHRNNLYHVSTEIPGLTNKPTWQMTNFISYIPENEYENDEWHVKYSFRPTGLKENDEFYIPGLALREYSERKDLPGYRNNYRGKDFIYAVAPQNVLAGTVVTQPGICCYLEGEISANPYNQYATTIVVHNGQQLKGVPINGKIFVNCTEDSYTYSREEYNKAVIQVVPQGVPGENIQTRSWQYSTSRLENRERVFENTFLNNFGQTTPTLGGGGPLTQGSSNSSNGVIRSETDKDDPNSTSEFYPTVEKERFELQEIPTYSMTWLGLKWLIGE